MNLTGLNDQQKQTLLDLLVIGMYADGKLADAEDAKIQGVLRTIQFSSDSARDQFLDASITRARRHLDSPTARRDFVADIAAHFPTQELRQKAFDDLEELLASDNQVVEPETRLLAVVKEEFKL